jgi:hypothetical protein
MAELLLLLLLLLPRLGADQTFRVVCYAAHGIVLTALRYVVSCQDVHAIEHTKSAHRAQCS